MIEREEQKYEMDSQQKVVITCNLIKYIIVLILTVISIYISKEVWQQYQSKATSFKQSQKAITKAESITVVLSFWPLKKMDYSSTTPYQSYEQWKLNSDFKISFGVSEWKTIKEKVELTENSADLSITHFKVGKVDFEKLITRYGYRYKISADVTNLKEPYQAFMQIEFDESIPYERIPEAVLIFSSENNSYGAIFTNWLEGDVAYMHKIRGFNEFRFQPHKEIKLKSDKCQTNSYFECLSSKLMNEDFSHCPRKCAAISTLGKIMPICEKETEFKCAYEIAKKFISSKQCLPSCSIMNMKKIFSYKEDQDSNAKRKIFVTYALQNSEMKVDEEFLIQDFVGMLGSIGGTLGMCIGFSFVGLSSFAIDHLLNMIRRLLSRKSSPEVDDMDQNVIKVENKPCKSEDLKKMISQLENTMKNFQIMGSDLETELKETQAAMAVRIQTLEEQLSKKYYLAHPSRVRNIKN